VKEKYIVERMQVQKVLDRKNDQTGNSVWWKKAGETAEA
jgi:hypothetical protein